MNDDQPLELVHGSGNVFRDLGLPDADVRQAKALMGVQIIKILDEEGLSTRQAEARTGVSHSEFTRIRRATYSRFTLDRLMGILSKLGREVDISIDVRLPRSVSTPALSPHP